MKNLTSAQFFIKLSVVFIPFVTVYIYIIIRSFFKKGFVFSGVLYERDSVLNGQTKISLLQDGNWPANASQVQNFSGISVAIVLLIVVFIIEKTMNIWSETFLNIIILAIGASSLVYAFSLQFWNCALDRSPDKIWLLRQRKIATALQGVGWNGLYLSVILCVSYASTYCGLILSSIGTVGLILTTELKMPKRK